MPGSQDCPAELGPVLPVSDSLAELESAQLALDSLADQLESLALVRVSALLVALA